MCIEAANKHEAVQIAEEMELGEGDHWEYRDNVSAPWVSGVFCDGQSLSVEGRDDVEGAAQEELVD